MINNSFSFCSELLFYKVELLVLRPTLLLLQHGLGTGHGGVIVYAWFTNNIMSININWFSYINMSFLDCLVLPQISAIVMLAIPDSTEIGFAVFIVSCLSFLRKFTCLISGITGPVHSNIMLETSEISPTSCWLRLAALGYIAQPLKKRTTDSSYTIK